MHNEKPALRQCVQRHRVGHADMGSPRVAALAWFAEHLALQTLAAASIHAAQTAILEHGGQRFLEVQRFERVRALGRLGLFSLTMLDAEFVGRASAGWPPIICRLASDQYITPEAADAAARCGLSAN